MTSRDLQRLEQFANQQRRRAEKPLDQEATALVLRTVDQLGESLALVQTTLHALGTLLEDHALPKALIGAMGSSATEIRSQLPSLREAAKDAGSAS